MTTLKEQHEFDANLDPLSGVPGSHPIGTGVGAALGGAASGVVVGSVVGPVGTVIGAAIGAIVGGLAGKGMAELVDPTFEENYWRDQFASRPYALAGATFEQYRPAYRFGIDRFGRYPGRGFDDVEHELALGWPAARGTSTLEWEHARHASRDAWNRLGGAAERTQPMGAGPN